MPDDICVKQSTIGAGGTNFKSIDWLGSLLNTLFSGSSGTAVTKDNGPAWTSVWGVSNAPVQSADMTSIAHVSDAPTSGQKLVITDIQVSTDTAMKLTFTEETSGLVICSLYVAAYVPVQVTFRSKRKLNVADKKLRCTASVAGNVSILVGYYSEA